MKTNAKILLELGKVRISLLATITMVAGYVLAAGEVGWTLLWVTVGVFLLASGASGFNQIQERDIDALMERTRGRPLPSRRVSLTGAVAASARLRRDRRADRSRRGRCPRCRAWGSPRSGGTTGSTRRSNG